METKYPRVVMIWLKKEKKKKKKTEIKSNQANNTYRKYIYSVNNERLYELNPKKKKEKLISLKKKAFNW